MPDAPRTGHLTEALRGALVDLLAARRPAPIRPSEVARGRRRAAARSFDDVDVVDGIAEQILALSTAG